MRSWLCFLLLPLAALAAESGSPPAAAERLFGELRCLVCSGESVAGSDSRFAADVRQLVRDRLAAGDSPAEVRRYLASRYGDAILLQPPLRPATWLLWLFPALAVLLGGIWLWRSRR